jgi:hypothetical protein
VCGLLNLKKAEEPDILFLSETKMSEEEMDRFRWQLDMPHMIAVDCKGRSGGLALFWRRGVDVRLRWKGRYHIDVDVIEENGTKWRFTGIYGESKSGHKENTWKLLRTLHHQGDLPWLCMGDFNEVLFAHEKEGGSSRAPGCMEAFRRALEDAKLSDLGFVGDPFTWRNNWHLAQGYVRERLDRAVANVEWRCLFPLYKIINGDPRHSDHRPVIAILSDQAMARGEVSATPSFRFEAAWLQEEGCTEVVEEAWNRVFEEGLGSVSEGVKGVGASLWRWDKEVLGELKKRIKKVRKALEQCRRAPISQDGVSKQHFLRYKLSRLEDQHSLYWQQRAHANWLKYGDHNTKYFHAFASERKKMNVIRSLKREGGGVVEGEEELGPFITNHYKSLFMSSVGPTNDALLQHVTSSVTEGMNTMLLRVYTVQEVNEALESIGDLKAPGPDGMPAIFYKKFWYMVGPKIQQEVLDVLNGGMMPDGWNETTIVLIPKLKSPERITDFRPISLCNVLYKLISKVIANRLKIVLPHIISPTQSAFVPGRMITDNVLLAYEVTHRMRRRKGGRDGLIAVKLDMSKAYDRVEWVFLEKIMLKLGFASAWVDVVMNCVRSVSYRVKLNRNLLDAFIPERGLRQGDPLSPYLFILCAEGLSALLRNAEEERSLQGIQLCPEAPKINHLFFADDSLIVMKANVENATKLQQILALYESQSGQMINKEKSSAMFSKGTKPSVKQAVLGVLEIPRESWNERYLGLPVHLGASKKKEFEYLKERIWQKIQGWKERLLSKAGKEIMIKAIAQAIPTYAMSCFDLTKALCEEISAMICRFWWSQQDGKNKCHWLSWEHMTRSKEDGGMGFRDLHIFNMAMLARQSWRMLQNPDSLCCTVLKALYFPTTSILEATAKPGMSYTWRSILRGLDLVKQGIIWRVGTGEGIDVWSDPWIPRGTTRRPRTPNGLDEPMRVADLINQDSGQWDEDLVRFVFQHEDAEEILSIPIRAGMEDGVAWHFDKKGIFSVKSAYRLGVSLRDSRQDLKGTRQRPSLPCVF